MHQDGIRLRQGKLVLNNIGHIQKLIQVSLIAAKAVGTLALNVYAAHQPAKAGLNVCLTDIERAIAERDKPHSSYQ